MADRTLIYTACCGLVRQPDKHGLNFAAIYLKKSFPDSKVLLVESPEQVDETVSAYDFVLLPLALKEKLKGRDFDLALNIWSFGEMPNHFISEWFQVIQGACQVRYFFTMNAFMPPVTTQSVERTRQGDWLCQFDEHWSIQHFEINSAIHSNPFIRNFYTSLCVLGQRLQNEVEIRAEVIQSRSALNDVLVEDWTQLALFARSNLSRPETEFNEKIDSSASAHVFFLSQLLATTEYIGRFNFESGSESTFFKLWNHFRLTKAPLVGELLVCFLAMVSKTLLETRCTKEEIQLLERLPSSSLHRDYNRFFSQSDDCYASVDKDSIQSACDKAIESFHCGRYDEAIDLLASVCVESSQHGEAWYYLALCHQKKPEILLGTLCARLAIGLGGSGHYQSCFESLFRQARRENPLMSLAVGFVCKRNSSFPCGVGLRYLDHLLYSAQNRKCISAGAMMFASGWTKPEILFRIADALGALAKPTLSKAVRVAAENY